MVGREGDGRGVLDSGSVGQWGAVEAARRHRPWAWRVAPVETRLTAAVRSLDRGRQSRPSLDGVRSDDHVDTGAQVEAATCQGTRRCFRVELCDGRN